MEKKEDAHKILSIATLVGTIILENGGEIYRAEDTVTRICKSRENIKDIDVFATHNALFVSFNFMGDVITNLRRVKNPGINLNKIEMINEFSRNFVANSMDLNEAKENL